MNRKNKNREDRKTAGDRARGAGDRGRPQEAAREAAERAIAVVAAATRRVPCWVSGVLGAGGLTAVAAPGGLLALHGLDRTLQVYDPVTDRSVERPDVVREALLGGRRTGGRLATRSCGTLRTRTVVRGLSRTTSGRRVP